MFENVLTQLKSSSRYFRIRYFIEKGDFFFLSAKLFSYILDNCKEK